MKLLVTAGPTREFLDDVRFLSNASTGRMGCAIAQAAADAGAQVTLVCGPISGPLPACDTLVPVTSAEEMRRAVLAGAADADAVIMAAAVADYRPAGRVPGKMRKDEAGLTLPLERTPDILAELGAQKGRRVLVGFALEAGDDARESALRKLREKRLDLIVLNRPAAMGAERASVELLDASGQGERLENLPKSEIATRLVRAVAARSARQQGTAHAEV